MSLRRLGVLLGKEFIYGSKGFVFIFSIVGPVVVSLVITLVFGSLFSQKPKLGIADEGSSRLVPAVTSLEAVIGREYATAAALREAVSAGSVDMGIVLPPDFDESVTKGEAVEVTAYVWGESLAKNRTILGATISRLIRDLAGEDLPVDIVAVSLGDAENVPWSDRLLPFIVLMTVLWGGTMVPATSLVEEKQKHTLTALTVTPTTLGEVFVAKGLVGVILSLTMAVVILAMNQAIGAQTPLLVAMLALGCVFSAALGILLGTFAKNVTTLFATIKFIGLFLYAPGLVVLFPQIPQWVARIFPTYYIIGPVIEITQRGGGWPDIIPDVSILGGLVLLLFAAAAVSSRRLREQTA